jgi:hypothetical protein
MHRKVKEVDGGLLKFTTEQLFLHITGACPYARGLIINPLISRYVSMLPVAILVHMKWYALSLSASSMLLHPLLHVAITV